MFYIHYTCRAQGGAVIEQFNDTHNLFTSKKQAGEQMQKNLEVFNVGCTKGIWAGAVVRAI